jgi:hypothetical protein
LETLVAAATAPRLTEAAADPAVLLLPKLVGKPWRQLAFGRRVQIVVADRAVVARAGHLTIFSGGTPASGSAK